jgi:cell division protein FtsA
MSQPVVVLDLGTSKAVALKAKLNDSGGLDILGLVSVDGLGIKKGAVSSIEDASRAADTALRHLAQELGTADIEEVVVTISGSQLEGSSVQGFKPIIPKNRTITGQDVMEVVNHSRSGLFPPERVQIQTIPREFRVDEKRNITQPVGLTGAKLEVISFMVTGQTTHVKNFENALELMNRRVNQFVFSPLASGVGVLAAKELQDGALVILERQRRICRCSPRVRFPMQFAYQLEEIVSPTTSLSFLTLRQRRRRDSRFSTVQRLPKESLSATPWT